MNRELQPRREAVKFVVYVPETYADLVRETLGKLGAGTIGDYTYCSFSTKGTGRFLPMDNAHPIIGEIGKMQAVAEERIETVCYTDDLQRIIDGINAVHPYEEVAYDIYPLVLRPAHYNSQERATREVATSVLIAFTMELQ